MELNCNPPLKMHIDLNSCFATCEQQAYPRLRGKPIAIAAYDTPRGCVIAPSIEAKQRGIKLGMTVAEARILCPGIIIKMPDPHLYRSVHAQFAKIFRDYSPDVVPKSIDEAVIDFTPMRNLQTKSLVEIGKEIKRRMREEIGEWMRCNVGIGTNRFLAKTAASLHKPDGLDVITHDNVKAIYSDMSLTDLCGINVRFQARLNTYGIFTPTQFLEASLEKLQKQVFQSIAGYYWFLRLRGWEIDDVEFKRKSYGQMYALGKKTADTEKLSSLLMKLTEKMARRLRRANMIAHGVHVGMVYQDRSYWHKGMIFDTEMYTTQELFTKVMFLFNKQPEKKVVTNISVTCFDIAEGRGVQESLFDDGFEKRRRVSDACDDMNDRYGEFVITPALMMKLDKIILDRVAFGNVKEIEEFYAM